MLSSALVVSLEIVAVGGLLLLAHSVFHLMFLKLAETTFGRMHVLWSSDTFCEIGLQFEVFLDFGQVYIFFVFGYGIIFYRNCRLKILPLAPNYQSPTSIALSAVAKPALILATKSLRTSGF